jgi:hypothetical protein
VLDLHRRWLCERTRSTGDKGNKRQWLSGVGENDPGLFVVSNHGDQSGICLWDRQKETPMIFDPNGLAGSI